MMNSTFFCTLFEPFLSFESRTFWPGLLLTTVVLCFCQWNTLLSALRSPSFWLDIQLLIGKQLFGFIFLGSSIATIWSITTHSILWLDFNIAIPQTDYIPQSVALFIYSTSLFLCWDFSRYILHKWMHEIPILWSFHQIHHSAEQLTPLTHHRIHPVESVLYAIRGIISTSLVVTVCYWLFRSQLYGSPIVATPFLGIVFNVVVGNFRHSSLWFPYPHAIEKWLISPAQHQIHHSKAPEHINKNYGTWLSIWDRFQGTLILSTNPPLEFGVFEEQRNHGNDILSAWFGPFSRAIFRRFLLLFFMVPLVYPLQAIAEESTDEETDEQEDNTDHIFIYSEEGLPREAGSAHVITEETKKQFSLQNVERILEQVPGISIRSEDGFGLRPNIGIRGANSDRSAKITLLEDGILFAPAPYAAPAAYYFPMMDRIIGLEIFKGAASTRYGPNTIGGAINLVTRTFPKKLSGSIALGMGSFGTNTLHAWLGTPNVVLEGSYLESSGFKKLDNGSPTGFQRFEVVSKLQQRFGSKHTIRAKLGYAGETSHETYLGLSINDFHQDPYQRYAASNLGNMSWNRLQATTSWHFKTDFLNIHTDAYIHGLNRIWKKFNRFAQAIDVHTLLSKESVGGQNAIYLDILRGKEDSIGEDQYLLIGTNDRRYQSMGLQSKLQWTFFFKNISHSLESGIRIHRDDVFRHHTEAPYTMNDGELVEVPNETIETLLHANTQATAFSGYIHDDICWKKIHIFPSLRIENITTQFQNIGSSWDEPITRVVVLPGFGALYSIDDWTDFFVSTHKGFSPVAPGQPEDIQPEESINYEIGYRKNEEGTHAEITGFFSDYGNITGQCTFSGGCTGDAIDTQFNGGKAWIYGLESLFGYTLPISPVLSLPLRGTYTLTKSQFRTGFFSSYPQYGLVEFGDKLPYVAEHQGRIQLGLESTLVSLYLGASYTSPMLDEAGTFGGSTLEIPQNVLFDASTHFQYKNVSLRLVGQNLLNNMNVSSFRPFGARPIVPRQFSLRLEVLQ